MFDKEHFKTEARKNYVLVNLDYPNQKELPPELAQQNRELRKQYKVDSFPTFCLWIPKASLFREAGIKAAGRPIFSKT